MAAGIAARRFGCFLAAVLCLVAAPVFGASSYHWTGAGTAGLTATDPADPTTQWAGANWKEGGAPGSADSVYLPLANAGSVYAAGTTINFLHVDGTSTAGALCITDGTTLKVNSKMLDGNTLSGHTIQSGGTCNVCKELVVGYGANSTGLYELSGTAVLNAGTYPGSYSADVEIIGQAGSGTFTQTGGTHTVYGNMYLGSQSSGNGTYYLSQGALNANYNEYIGVSGSGTFTQTGGTHTVGWVIYVGGAAGNYNLVSGDLHDSEVIGNDGPGTFTQSGGTHTVGTLTLTSTGSYTLSSGDLKVTSTESLSGLFTQTGGTHTATGASMTIERGGSYVLSAGTLTTQWKELVRGTFNQSGGTHTTTSGPLYYYGTYLLSGGNLNTKGGESIGGPDGASFTQTGGTHTATGGLAVGDAGFGTYTLSSGDLNAQHENIGISYAGTFIQTGGTNSVGGVSIGAGSAYILQGGTLAVTGVLSGGGILALEGGAYSGGADPLFGGICFGYASGANTSQKLDGTLSLLPVPLYVGYSGTANVSQTSGTYAPSMLSLARNLGASGAYTLSSGTLHPTTDEYIGYSGTGIFTQTGGTNTSGTHMDLGSTATGVGSYELDGGSLTVPTINVGVAGQGTFRWIGGTLSVRDIEIGGIGGRFSVGQTAPFAGKVHANGGSIGVDLGDTLTLLGEFGTTQAGKTIMKDGAGVLRIEGAQVYAASSIFSVAEGTVFMDTAAGDATTHNLEVHVGGGGSNALVVFEADEYLSMLHIMDGGEARLGEGCHVLVLDTLWIDGIGQFQNVTLTPEPATLAVVAFGALAAMARRRRHTISPP